MTGSPAGLQDRVVRHRCPDPRDGDLKRQGV
jgi:hypothetical protein